MRSSSARANGQLNLPPVEVQKPERSGVAFRKSEQAPEVDESTATASTLFDEALRAARIETGEVAYLLGVSESLVLKMRSANERACPSFAQMLKLPPAFHLELQRAMNRRFGFGRAALARLLDAAGDLAVLSEVR